MTDEMETNDKLPESVTIKEFNDLQIESLKQSLFIINTMIQKVLALEKTVEELKSATENK